MKKTIFKVLTIALMAVFAVFFTACPEDPDNNDNNVNNNNNGNNNGNNGGGGIIEMINVSGGSFQMGYFNEYTVTLTGFYMSKTEVTQEQYQIVMEINPSSFKTDAAEGETQNRRPVEQVSWYDTLVFCNKLSILEGLTPAYSIDGKIDPDEWGPVPTKNDVVWNTVEMAAYSNGYRLPTEAQWEYAAKGGSSSSNPYKIYSGSDTVGNVAWYKANSGNKTHEVGKKAANELGIYDMSGNVSEWCWDWNGTYPSEAQTDPLGAFSGTMRAYRGGFWFDTIEYLPSVERDRGYPFMREGVGFRLVRP